MSRETPWGINRIGNMFPRSGQVQTQRYGAWVRAVATPYRKNFTQSVRAAWWVLTGKAEAVIWPEAGELEQSLVSTVEQESSDRICQEADGCPTEKAVLQRFWRSHQGKPATPSTN